MTRPEAEAAWRRRRASLEQGLDRLPSLEERHASDVEAADRLVAEAEAALAVALVPSLADEAALARTAAAFGLPALEPLAVRRSLAARRAALETRAAELRAEAAMAALPSSLEQARARAVELAAPIGSLRASVRALEADEDFSAFWEARDNDRWWTLSFHRARAAGERALARHGKARRAEDLEELCRRHEREREALVTLTDELRAADGEHQRLSALHAARDRSEQELAGLAAAVLDELRAAAGRAARFLPEAELLERTGAEGRRLSGCRARRRYLEAMGEHWLARTRRELLTRLHDAELALSHGGSGLGAVAQASERELDAETRRLEGEVEQRLAQYESTAERLLAFSSWERCDPLAGELWWDAFTAGVVDGSFIDEVAWHRTVRRAPGQRVADGGADRRAAWQRNADNAMAALAEATAGVGEAPAPVTFDDED